ncbi:MAG: hypothetical protein D6788_01090 [Planctomycetota bacterium]|nr:MAG: hypothetical protein D6788_01090 [Planctomycetota bacterium]
MTTSTLKLRRMLILMALPLPGLAAPPESQTGGAEPKQETAAKAKVIELRKADPYDISNHLRKWKIGCPVIPVGGKTLMVLNPSPEQMEVIRAVVDEYEEYADPVETRLRVEFLPIGSLSRNRLNATLYVLGKGFRYAIDESRNLLIVNGTAEQIEAARRLLRKLQPDQRPVTLYFTFLSARVNPDDEKPASNLPDALQPVTETLRRSGFADIALVAPIVVHTSAGGAFETSGMIATAEEGESSVRHEFALHGSIHLEDDGEKAFLTVTARVEGSYRKGQSHYNGDVFSANVTTALEMDKPTLLAASPAPVENGDAVILVVRAENR